MLMQHGSPDLAEGRVGLVLLLLASASHLGEAEGQQDRAFQQVREVPDCSRGELAARSLGRHDRGV